MRSSILFLFCLIVSFLLLVGCKKDRPKVLDKSISINARFIGDHTILTQGDVVNFSDSTEGYPLTWRWYFDGGVPATSNLQHPKEIRYNQLGEYDVTLIVTNAYGADTLVRTGYIKVTRALDIPVLETFRAYEIEVYAAKMGGVLLKEGVGGVREMGICWSRSPSPTVNNNKIISGQNTLGDFGVKMTGLDERMTYYYRAYAINRDGVGYGREYNFTTLELDTCDFISEKFTDSRDGNIYRYFELTGKMWMGDNLNYNSADSWCYGDNTENCDEYGRLYSIQAAMEACPAGWRLPTNAEWDNLIVALGDNPGVKMKKKNSWTSASATNDVCFSAEPGGYRNINTGTYGTESFFGYWWTASRNSENLNISKHISYDNYNVQTLAYDSDMAFSVRCIRD